MTRTILFLLLLCCGLSLNAQHEIGVSIGTSHLLGDFGGGVGDGSVFVKDIDFQSAKPAFGLFYRYNFLKFLAFRGQFLYGSLSGSDAYTPNPFRSERGLASKSPVFDFNAQLEFNFIPLKFCNGKFGATPYLASGIGWAKVNPTIYGINDEGIDPAENEFIGDNDNQSSLTIPLSLGMKFKTKKNIIIGVEASHRIFLEDNLDNYYRQENDQYFFLTANISYVFCNKNRLGRINKQGACPAF